MISPKFQYQIVVTGFYGEEEDQDWIICPLGIIPSLEEAWSVTRDYLMRDSTFHVKKIVASTYIKVSSLEWDKKELLGILNG